MSFAWRARVAVEVRYGWLCVVGVSGANAPVNAQPHQKIAAMLGRPGHSTAWCVDGGQCPLLTAGSKGGRNNSSIFSLEKRWSVQDGLSRTDLFGTEKQKAEIWDRWQRGKVR